MTNRSRDKGTAWESAIVAYLREHGWPHAERRARAGAHDRGDIAGVAGVVIEAKNEARVTLAGYIAETLTEQANAAAAVGAAWVKRRGKTSAGDGYVIMTGRQFVQLLREAGY